MLYCTWRPSGLATGLYGQGRILLEQSFTFRMPLLMATSTFRLGKRHQHSHSLVNIQEEQTFLRPFVQDYPCEPIPEETLTHPPS